MTTSLALPFLLLWTGSQRLNPHQHYSFSKFLPKFQMLQPTTRTRQRTTTTAMLGASSHHNDEEKGMDHDDLLPSGLLVEHNVVSDYAWKILEHWIDTGGDFVVEHKCAFVKEETQQTMSYPIPWEIGGQSRKVAQFGSLWYDYERSCVVSFDDDEADQEGRVAKIPSPLRTLLRLDEPLALPGHSSSGSSSTIHNFTQCIINVYDAETIIPWHVDDEMFGSIVLVFTFGEDRPLYLRRLKKTNKSDDKAPTTTDSNNSSNANSDSSLLWKQFRALEWSENPEILDPSRYEYYVARPRHGSRYILSGDVRSGWEHAIPPGKGRRISLTFRTEKKTE